MQSIVFLLVSLFIGNEFTVDDLGLLLVVVGVVILIMGVIIYRAAVCSSVQGYYPLTSIFQRMLAWRIIPIEYRDELFRRVSSMFHWQAIHLTDACTQNLD